MGTWRNRGVLFALLGAEAAGQIKDLTAAEAVSSIQSIRNRIAANKEKYDSGRDTFVAAELAQWHHMPDAERVILSHFFCKNATRTEIYDTTEAAQDYLVDSGIDLAQPLSTVLAHIIGLEAVEHLAQEEEEVDESGDDDDDDESNDDDDDDNN